MQFLQTEMLKESEKLSEFVDSVLVRLKAIEVLSEASAPVTGVESQKEAIQAALDEAKSKVDC